MSLAADPSVCGRHPAGEKPSAYLREANPSTPASASRREDIRNVQQSATSNARHLQASRRPLRLTSPATSLAAPSKLASNVALLPTTPSHLAGSLLPMVIKQ
jgi:hypothetical protein